MYELTKLFIQLNKKTNIYIKMDIRYSNEVEKPMA